MKISLTNLALIACTLSLSAEAATVINVNALNPSGQTLTLGAGTYQVSIVGTSTCGAIYNGWDVATQNYGAANASAAPNEWTERFGITIGGVTTAYDLPGAPFYGSAAAALAAFQNGGLYANSGSTPTSVSGIPDTAMFTLTGTQAVQFAVSDIPGFFGDNWGGDSLSISKVASATPEPSTFGFMGLAMIGAAGVLRRKFLPVRK